MLARRSRPTASPFADWSVAATAGATFLGIGLVADDASAARPAIGGCPILPLSSPWNQRVDGRPVDPLSSTYIASAGRDLNLSASYHQPVNVVSRGQRGIRVRSTQYGIDAGRYPIPRRAVVQPSSDRHLVVLQRGTCRVFELWRAQRTSTGWAAGSGTIWNILKDQRPADGVSSATASGTHLIAGTMSARDARSKAIDHAIGVTLPTIRRAWVAPATFSDGVSSDRSVMPMGSRLRLRPDVDLSGLPRQTVIIATAMKRYGLIVSDSSSPAVGTEYDGFGISATPSRNWSESARRALYGFHLRDFEVVAPSGPVRGPAS